MEIHEKEALERLINLAQQDTGQSRRVANFLLAWWNAEECGGFDLTDLWSVDKSIAMDMVKVFTFISHKKTYPNNLDYQKSFNIIVEKWSL